MLAFKRVKKERIYSWSKTKLRLWGESSDWVLSRKTVRGWYRRTGNTGALAVSVQQIKVTEKEEKAGLLQEDSSSARWALKNNSASSDCVNSDASKPHPCATSYKTNQNMQTISQFARIVFVKKKFNGHFCHTQQCKSSSHIRNTINDTFKWNWSASWTIRALQAKINKIKMAKLGFQSVLSPNKQTQQLMQNIWAW